MGSPWDVGDFFSSGNPVGILQRLGILLAFQVESLSIFFKKMEITSRRTTVKSSIFFLVCFFASCFF